MQIQMKKKPIEPKNQRIETLVNSVNSRELVIPPFQREFVWKEDKILFLFDSILKTYPIGSFLIWNSPQKIKCRDTILDIKLPKCEFPDIYTRDFILDGQQRLSTLYGVLTWKDANREHIFNVYLDLESMEFFHYQKKMKIKKNVHFPMGYLYDYEKFLDFRNEIKNNEDLEEEESKKLQDTLNYLYNHFRNYIIPVIVTYEKTVEEVSPIFIRFNSGGLELGIFDLISAMTWSDNFDFRQEIDKINKGLQKKRFQQTKYRMYLKILAALNSGSTKGTHINKLGNLNSEQLNSLLKTTEKALNKAVDYLQSNLFVYGDDFLPYENQLVVFTYFFAKIKNPRPKQLKYLRSWFWKTGFSEHFRGSTDTILDEDLRLIDRLQSEELKVYSETEIFDFNKDELLGKKYNKASAFTKAFILMLLSLTPKDIINGSTINVQKPLIDLSKEFHHLFSLKTLRCQQNNVDDKNNLCNICLIQSTENNKINRENPSQYLKNCYQELGIDAKKVFLSNLIPTGGNSGWNNDDYAKFLQKRAQLITERINELANFK